MSDPKNKYFYASRLLLICYLTTCVFNFNIIFNVSKLNNFTFSSNISTFSSSSSSSDMGLFVELFFSLLLLLGLNHYPLFLKFSSSFNAISSFSSTRMFICFSLAPNIILCFPSSHRASIQSLPFHLLGCLFVIVWV